MRIWLAGLRDNEVRTVVEETLRNRRHKDRLRAAALVLKHAREEHPVLSLEEARGLLLTLVDLVRRHADPGAAKAIEDELHEQMDSAIAQAEHEGMTRITAKRWLLRLRKNGAP